MKLFPSSLAVPPVLSALLLAIPALAASGELWIAPDGSDTNTGSSNAPLASLGAAMDKWRAWTRRPDSAPPDALRIVLRGGIYPLAKPFVIQTTDFKLQNIRIRIEAALGEHPVLSGGVEIGGWTKLTKKISGLTATAQEEVWVADAPKIGGHMLEFRQLWVNGTKAIRAREPNGEKLSRLVAWNKTNQAAVIPAAALDGIKEPGCLEMVIDQVWEVAELRVKSIRFQGTNAFVTFKQPESQIEFEHPWPPVIINAKYQAPFFLANAIELLDEPGEWFEDLTAGKVYYWPHDREDMARAKVFAPAIKTLVQIEGSPDQPIANVQFKGITFAHTTWLRPAQQGHVPLQAGMFLLDAKKLSPKGTSYHSGLDNLAWIGRPPAAVAVKNADHVSFEDCTFENLASAGLDFAGGTHDDLVQSCIFRDLGGNGIQLGHFSDSNVETHVPWNPSDPRETCARETIADNVINDCGNEDWGCVGVAVGYARNVSIEHNEIFNLPYTGISVGWGWTKTANALRDNFIFANHVHQVGLRLGDLGGIYTLSAQPGTVIAENSISDISPSPFVPDPNHWFYLYLDEGSSGITVRDNWCPAGKFLRNANGPGNVWTNNGPAVSEKIKNSAGLEAPYRNLLLP